MSVNGIDVICIKCGGHSILSLEWVRDVSASLAGNFLHCTVGVSVYEKEGV